MIENLFIVTGMVEKNYNYRSENKSFSRIVMAECESDAIILVQKSFEEMNSCGVTQYVFNLEAHEVIRGKVSDDDRRKYG